MKSVIDHSDTNATADIMTSAEAMELENEKKLFGHLK